MTVKRQVIPDLWRTVRRALKLYVLYTVVEKCHANIILEVRWTNL